MIKVISILFLLFSIKFYGQVQAIANFSASTISGCAPLVVQFTDLSTGGITTRNWNFGNSNMANSTNPATIYSVPGVYTVTLTVSNSNSTNTMIKTNYIVVYSKPNVNFNLNTDTACIGQSIIFNDATSIGNGAAITNFSWDFGDGINQLTPMSTVTHSYSSSGNYPISLIANDANGCSGSITKNSVILPKPTISFSATPLFSCTTPLNVNFTNTSPTKGLTNYIWKFGDGFSSNLLNPSHTYSNSGSYPIKLISNQNGCLDSIIVPNKIIIQNITVDFLSSTTNLCIGQPITFTNTSTPNFSISAWDFGDGQTSNLTNPIHSYTTSGTYSVSLFSSNTNGCSGIKTYTVLVNPAPSISFTANRVSSCSIPFAVTFNNSSSGSTSFEWNFGDGTTSTSLNPIHTYTASGAYSVKLKASNSTGNCSDSLIKINYINISPPIASFISIPDSGCVPLPVTFTNNSSSNVDPILSYNWEFGDGNASSSSSLTTTTNTYTNTGIYSPTLIIQTASGCKDTITCINCIKVGNVPTANFTFDTDSICYGAPINFSNTSVGANSNFWIFGDGANSIISNDLHVYGDTGTYKVKIVAYNNGCSDTSSIQKVVVMPPKANFTYSLNCTNYFTVLFDDSSAGSDSLVWDFGDGTVDILNTKSPIHTYTNNGTATINVTSYNYKSGCNNTKTSSITISKPIASFSVNATSGCYPFTPLFTNTSQNSSLLLWNFGNLNTIADTSINNIASYTYNNPGTYSVSLIIKDINGCKDSIKNNIQALGSIPYFYADSLNGCRPLPVIFTDTSIIDSPIINWNWDFGDGNTLNTINNPISHTYSSTGNYTVSMTVTDANGCINSIQKNNYIKPTFPIPYFTVDTFACKYDVISFDASATSAINPTYKWDFGDGAIETVTTTIINHTYTLNNTYVIKLTVTDINGCDSTISDTVRILKPKANFNWNILNAGCGSLLISFNDASSSYINSWYWNFGNGAYSTLQNPNYTYTQPGIYNVSLIATNLGGCKDTLSKDSIIVVDGPIGTFSFSPHNGCSPLNVNFLAESSNSQNYIWDFGDGTVINNGDSINHIYNNTGTYNPTLILGNTLSNGAPCYLPATNQSGLINVYSQINVALNPTSLLLPEDSIAQITPIVSGGISPYSYNWTPNNSNISCDNCINPVMIKGSGTEITYLFTVTDSQGCVGQESITIYSPPCLQYDLIPNIFSPNGDGINDAFFIPKICSEGEYSLQIFNRWGLLMYNTNLRNDIWDGKTSLGDNAPDGTYFIIVKVNDKNYKGFINLIR